ncbi:MAG: SEL1-like repeat protein, partial [Clostridiales bacterium]|nr:SEL1-like repeat protein [Clostridiales bacterium]
KAKAAYWYEKAAQQGIAQAQFNLAACYYNGQGVTRDRAKAKEWFQKAADQGVEQAKAILRKYF